MPHTHRQTLDLIIWLLIGYMVDKSMSQRIPLLLFLYLYYIKKHEGDLFLPDLRSHVSSDDSRQERRRLGNIDGKTAGLGWVSALRFRARAVFRRLPPERKARRIFFTGRQQKQRLDQYSYHPKKSILIGNCADRQPPQRTAAVRNPEIDVLGHIRKE